MAFMEKFQHLKIQLKDIISATNNFDDENFIGKGGFGKVYKGVLSHYKGRSMVAFKRLDRTYGQGNPEFLKEIVMLSRTHTKTSSLSSDFVTRGLRRSSSMSMHHMEAWIAI